MALDCILTLSYIQKLTDNTKTRQEKQTSNKSFNRIKWLWVIRKSSQQNYCAANCFGFMAFLSFLFFGSFLLLSNMFIDLNRHYILLIHLFNTNFLVLNKQIKLAKRKSCMFPSVLDKHQKQNCKKIKNKTCLQNYVIAVC